MSLGVTHVGETSITTSGSIIWSGVSKALLLVNFQVSSDSFEVYIRNNSLEIMSFDLSSMRSDYKLDQAESTGLFIYMYHPNRWVLDFRSFNGLYPDGSVGVELGLRSTSGTKTLNCAMVTWRVR